GNLVGMLNFEDFKRKMPSDAQAIFVASNGLYNFLGTNYSQDSAGRFDRLRVVQDGRIFGFVRDDYQWVNPFGEGIRGQEDAGLFALPAASGFDPLKPWRLELFVNGTVVGVGAPQVTAAFGLDYNVPDLQALTTSLDDARAKPVAADQRDVGDRKDSDVRRPAEPEGPPVPAWVDALG